MGSKFLVKGEIKVGQIVTTMMSIMIGSFALGHVGPFIHAFQTATVAASKIYATIDRVSPMDPTSLTGYKPPVIEGTIELRRVRHIYPSRPEVVVMKDVDLVIPLERPLLLSDRRGPVKVLSLALWRNSTTLLVEKFF